MATVGQPLTAPEAGWQRFDDFYSRIKFVGSNWVANGSASNCYAGTSHYIYSGLSAAQVQTNTVQIRAYCSKIRIIADYYPEHSSQLVCKADGATIGTANMQYSSANQILAIEYNFGSFGVHDIVLSSGDGLRFDLDAIDIDKAGFLLPSGLGVVTKISELAPGKVISCDYTASTSGSVGTFSNLGAAELADIPVASSATPNGKFLFMCAGYDTQGKIKLIPDRNIQHSISWDTINTAGFASGAEVDIGGTKGIMRLMSGGVSSTDTDNEWDKIIVGSTLGGTITAGDNAVWNWSNLYTTTSTRLPTNCSYRGVTAAGGRADDTGTSYVNQNAGFRPVFLVDNPKNYYLFRKEDGTAHKFDGSAMIQVTSDWNALSDANKEIAFLAASQEIPSASLLAVLGKYKPMVYSVDTAMATPSGAVSAAPKDRAIIPKGLISLAGFEGIDSATLTKTLSGSGGLALAVTTDLTTYKVYSGGAWVEIDIANVATFKASGMTPAALAALTRTEWNLITTGEQGIGFAYLPTVEVAADVASVAEIDLTVDMKGAWTRAVHGTDFTHAYPKNNLLRIQLLTSGDYKVNYHEAATA